MTVLPQLAEHVQTQDHTATHAKGQAQNIQKSIATLAVEIRQRNLKVVFEHAFSEALKSIHGRDAPKSRAS